MRHDVGRGLLPADRIGLVAIAGILLSFGVWVAFAAVDTAMSASESFSIQVFAPDAEQALIRLSAIVLVLMATLLTQMLYASRMRVEEQLHVERRRLQQMYDHSPDAILALDHDLMVAYANPASRSVVGLPPEAAPGTTCHKGVWGSDAPCAGCLLPEVRETGETRERTIHGVFDGVERWLSQVIYPVLDETGAVGSFVEIIRDDTELRVAEEALQRSYREMEDRVVERTGELVQANAALEVEITERERTAGALTASEERYRQLVESSPDMVLVHREGKIAFVNSPGATLMGLESADSAEGSSIRGLWEPNGSGMTRDELYSGVGSGILPGLVSAKLKRRDGTLVDVEISVGRLAYQGESAVQCVVRDITERVRAQETIQRMAYYDPLTNLPNRTLFQDRLKSALAQARRREEIVAVIFVDLDDFKSINDTLGHVVGDEVLCAVGERLTDLMREEDTVSRQSGDEFTILARVSERDDACLLAERILEALRPSVEVCGYELHVSASIGVATYPDDGDSELVLIKNADAAMYSAKDWGHNVCRMYDPSMSQSALDRLAIESMLRGALEREEFELYYQPQVDMRSGHLVGLEALLRWNHPVDGVVAPGGFLEIAEQAGFMGQLGKWVLDTACRQAAEWLDAGCEFDHIAVNLSAKEFVQQDIVGNVKRILAETGIEPCRLELEITETTAMHNVENVFAVLSELRELGVRIAIDDFGTGYSSMSYLTRFPIQTLKIAQDFMRDVHISQQSAAIASMLVELCHQLDLDIVAEGVEHPSQLEFLRERGCFVIQGYIFSEPVPASEIVGLLELGLTLSSAPGTLRLQS